DPHPLPQQNVLSVVDPKLTSAEEVLLVSARQQMFQARSGRVRPHLDDKVLASWNGMMLGALARAFAVLGDESYRAAAEKNLAFLRSRLWDESIKTLYHRWRQGERDSVQLLTGYANLCAGTLDLYEATLAPVHLEFAAALADAMLAKFYDAANGGFFDSAAGPRELILRCKDDYDGAEPSGNAVAVLALLRLAAMTGNKQYAAAAEKTLHLLAPRLHDLPQAVPYLLLGLDFYLEEPRRAVVAGAPEQPETRALLRAIHSVYQPNKVVMGTAGVVDPFNKTLPAKDGPVVYLCTGTACQPPTQDQETIRKFLAASSTTNP
ncbi:MAG TPA: glycoside hydrolase family 76 protein, partial [Candidatus Cybelea sp.]|nr:glycoside hydrolase family 76 protein [Candidatus Cybelea sp.]